MRRLVFGLVAILSVVGCERRSGDAIILAKEHIDAAAPTTETPTAGGDEIAVDSYVMKPEVRGTSRDPRALKDEQWLVKVRVVYSGRTLNVHADQSQFEKLKTGDRVDIRYRVGKYTGTRLGRGDYSLEVISQLLNAVFCCNLWRGF
jgi:hypothetical protein